MMTVQSTTAFSLPETYITRANMGLDLGLNLTLIPQIDHISIGTILTLTPT